MKILITFTLSIFAAAALAQTTINPVNVGAAANDGTGDPLRTAFNKINTNEAALNAGKMEATNPVVSGTLQGDSASFGVLTLGSTVKIGSAGTIQGFAHIITGPTHTWKTVEITPGATGSGAGTVSSVIVHSPFSADQINALTFGDWNGFTGYEWMHSDGSFSLDKPGNTNHFDGTHTGTFSGTASGTFGGTLSGVSLATGMLLQIGGSIANGVGNPIITSDVRIFDASSYEWFHQDGSVSLDKGGTTNKFVGTFSGTLNNPTVTNGATMTGILRLAAAGGIAFSKTTVSISNGEQLLNPGTNTYIEATGSPSGLWSFGGITGGTDGRVIIIENSTSQDMDFANQFAGESAANRIRTGTGSDYATSNRPGIVALIYNASASRWDILFHN